MIRVQARPRVVVIIVQGDDLAVGARDFDKGIIRGAEPAGVHFRHDGLAGLAFHLEDVPVARPIRAAVDDDRQRHLLRLGRFVIGFLVQALGQRIPGERQEVGDQGPRGGGNPMHARLGIRGRGSQRRLVQIPAVHLQLNHLAHASAQRKDAGHKRQFTDGNPIDETLASAEQRLVDCEHILAVLGNLAIDQGIRIGAVIVVIGDLLAVGVVQPHYGLEPTGNAIRDVGHQVPGLGGDDQPLPLVRGKTIPIHLARRDLAVHRARHADPHLFFFPRSFALRQILLAQHRELHGLHRPASDLGHLADVEGERVGDPSLGDYPDLAPARLGIGVDRHLGKDEFGLGTNGRVAFVLGKDLFDPFDQFLLGQFFLGLGRFALGLARLCLAGFFQVRIAFGADGRVNRVGAAANRADQRGDRIGSGIGADRRGKLERGHRGHHRVLHDRLRLLQCLQLLAQQPHLLVVQDTAVFNQPHGDAFPADHQVRGIGESLPPQPDRERGALLAAGGIDVTDILALRPGRRCCGDECGQPENGETKSIHGMLPWDRGLPIRGRNNPVRPNLSPYRISSSSPAAFMPSFSVSNT